MDKNCSHLHSKFHYVSIKMGTAMVDIQNAYHSKFHYVSIKIIQISDRIMFLAFSKFHYVSIKIGTMLNLCVLMFSLNSTMFLLRS